LRSELSAYDIWALDDFAQKKITVPVNVINMNAPQRVAARTLIDAGLLYLADVIHFFFFSASSLGAGISRIQYKR
jgi:hypothetical protein